MVGDDLYGDFETEARKRLSRRDPEDWPILAAALALGCPIWTEDTDFFGCGVATWTSASIGSFLTQLRPTPVSGRKTTLIAAHWVLIVGSTAIDRSTTNAIPSWSMWAGHSGHIARTSLSHPSSFSRNLRGLA